MEMLSDASSILAISTTRTLKFQRSFLLGTEVDVKNVFRLSYLDKINQFVLRLRVPFFPECACGFAGVLRTVNLSKRNFSFAFVSNDLGPPVAGKFPAIFII